MPQATWSAKRERQFKHIKDGLIKSGREPGLATEIAARTVNKERAQHGESKEASKTSLQDMPAGRRGGLHSHSGPMGRTYAQLYQEARKKNIKGRSSMNKAELELAVDYGKRNK
ncbi:plasmid stabilization protein [Undibacterium sp.]|uniref:plasmid stabilization protein n=1 Tax=Undibacterium sp. TaxID=1914977 RepID=UPI0027318731|nr:plasmid stabilization protein [Undibacterium sp.]MDP1977286.1 plasmid stabilization protein [Undibacterium sp.]